MIPWQAAGPKKCECPSSSLSISPCPAGSLAEGLILVSASNSQSQGLLPFLALRTWPTGTSAHPKAGSWDSINFTCLHAAASWFSWVSQHMRWCRSGILCFSPPQDSSTACSRMGQSLGYHSAQDKKRMPRSQPRTTRQAGFAESFGSKSPLKTPKKKGKISKNENEYKSLCYPEHKGTGTTSLTVEV